MQMKLNAVTSVYLCVFSPEQPNKNTANPVSTIHILVFILVILLVPNLFNIVKVSVNSIF
ncbi:hypothetical protein PSDI105340_08525 [Pseudoalteromonas distincta]